MAYKSHRIKAENEGYIRATYGYFANEILTNDKENAITTQAVAFNATPNVDLRKQSLALGCDI